MYQAAYLELNADLDRDFDFEFEATDANDEPFDFTDYSAVMEVRESRSTNAPLLATVTVTLTLGWIRGAIAKADMPALTEDVDGWADLAMTDPGGKTYNWTSGPFNFKGVSTDA